MRYVVHTRATIQSINPLENHAILSITDSDTVSPPLFPNARCHGVLRVVFDDVDAGSGDVGRPVVLFDAALARTILDFWRAARDAGAATIYIHCNAGQSRSPAVAAALTRLDGGDDDPWFRRRTPNRLVYRTLLEVGMGLE